MNSLLKLKNFILVLSIALLFSTCNDDKDKNYINSLYTGMQGIWHMSGTTHEINGCTYNNMNTIEFLKDGTAYIREVRIKRCGNEAPVTNILNETKYQYQLDLDNEKYIFLLYKYKYKVNTITDKIINVSVFNWSGNGEGWIEEWTRL